jgi:translation initiation factor 2B subunit (eIF-2B alpha/beta/delta family)
MSVLKNPGEIQRRVSAIAGDRRQGASQLACRALSTLARCVPRDPAAASALYLRELRALAGRFAGLRPGMPAIANATARAMREITTAARNAPKTRDAQRIAARCVKEELRHVRAARENVARQFRAEFPGIRTPLTISYSATVVAALGAAGVGVRSVTVCESRPLFEGRAAARELRGRLGTGIDVVVITEAQAGAVLGECDALVIGCDAIFSDGSVANKSGSALIASAAQQEEIPVIVLGDIYKFASRSVYQPEAHPGSEVWRKPPAGVSVRNNYFEVVPARHVSVIVLETGVFAPRQVTSLWRRERGRRRRSAA